ncbi:MAG: hypothetical protein A2289_00570 [Deltaproteobacteria bacterium RIFOXYA12_FULL_58_15]|nr:MAG: hypothetical protein A2289_00570 [Deltaproteobacteria bacterium RIFOXYA12_FULL_58_15]OGR12566.1 MAG: hypothetical protein A2341_00460 [Deltaproteobacteria bacterium RIFOXYB12_FULL_58_9]
MAKSAEEVASAMLALLKDYHGKKNLKAMDLTKAMIEKFGEDNCDKKLCKLAIRQLVEASAGETISRCAYSYVGGSYVVLNPEYKF